MDLSTIIVVVVGTALSLGAIVWMEIHSRGKQPESHRSEPNPANATMFSGGGEP